MNNNQQQDNQLMKPTEGSDPGRIFGILSIVFGIVGLFLLGIVFFPLSLVLAIVAVWKRNYLLGGIGVLLSIIVAVTSPSIWLILGTMKAYNTEVKKQEQIQQVAQEIGTKKQNENQKKQEAFKKAGIDGLNKLKTAFAESNNKGVDAFRNASALEFIMMSENSDLKADVLKIKEAMKLYVSDFTKKNGWKGSAPEMTVLLKYLYFNATIAQQQLPADNVDERQKFASSMGSIEDAFRAVEKGELPGYAITTRSYKDGTGIPGKAVVEKTADGKFLFRLINN